MKMLRNLSIVTIAVAPVLASAALANGSGTNHGRSSAAPGHNKSQQTSSTGTSSTTTTTSPSSNAKAYGRLCQAESKQQVAGQSRTAFSKCVTDLAHMAKNSKTNPHRACANESKKHVAGQKGTPYSQCVVAAAKLRGQKNGQSGSSTTATGS